MNKNLHKLFSINKEFGTSYKYKNHCSFIFRNQVSDATYPKLIDYLQFDNITNKLKKDNPITITNVSFKYDSRFNEFECLDNNLNMGKLDFIYQLNLLLEAHQIKIKEDFFIHISIAKSLNKKILLTKINQIIIESDLEYLIQKNSLKVLSLCNNLNNHIVFTKAKNKEELQCYVSFDDKITTIDKFTLTNEIKRRLNMDVHFCLLNVNQLANLSKLNSIHSIYEIKPNNYGFNSIDQIEYEGNDFIIAKGNCKTRKELDDLLISSYFKL